MRGKGKEKKYGNFQKGNAGIVLEAIEKGGEGCTVQLQ